MTQRLIELVEQFCQYQLKQRGKTVGGVATYRWNLDQFLRFVHLRAGRPARLADLSGPVIQAWMDAMAAADLALNTLRCRQATLSSFCTWLVKRGHLLANPILQLDRPPHQRVPPTVPGPPTGPRPVPRPPVHGDAAGLGGRAPRAPPGGELGLPRGAGQRGDGPGHPGAGPRHALPARLRGPGAAGRVGRGHPGHPTLLVRVGPDHRRTPPPPDDGEEHLAALQSLRAADRGPPP